MTQLDLLEQQKAELARVSSAIAQHVMAYCDTHRQFRMAGLVAYVRGHVPHCAPDSPSRILRALKRNGQVRYQVINRRESLYEVL